MTDAPSNEIALQNVLTPDEIDPLLAGFEFASPDETPIITLDVNRRFYFNSGLRKMFRVKSYDAIAIAYKHDTHELAIFTGRGLVVPDNHKFTLDKRHYASARKFVKEQKIDYEAGPLHFVYNRGLSKYGVYVFKLAEKLKSVRKDVTPVYIEKTPEQREADLFTPAIASVTLIEGDRLVLTDVTNTAIFVRHSASPMQFEISYEEFPGSVRVNVDSDGQTDAVRQFSGMYTGKRPVTFDYHGVTPSGVLAFRKVKA